jgi:maleate isomerase
VKRFGLVTPYTDDVQAAIIRHYREAGWDCVAERHFGIAENYAFAEVPEATLAAAIRDVAAAKPDAIAILCTNLRGAPLVDALERETGIPIYDSIATVVWQSLRRAGADASRIRGWGRLFDL